MSEGEEPTRLLMSEGEEP